MVVGLTLFLCSITYPPFWQNVCQKDLDTMDSVFFQIFTQTTRKLDDLLLLQLSFYVINEVDLKKGACCRKIVVTFA